MVETLLRPALGAVRFALEDLQDDAASLKFLSNAEAENITSIAKRDPGAQLFGHSDPKAPSMSDSNSLARMGQMV